MVVLCVALTGHTDTKAAVLSLEACIDSALANNPAVAAAALAVEKARLLERTAFNPSGTEITLKQETTGGGGPENGVYFGQSFDFPTVYMARRRALKEGSVLASGRFNVKAAEIEKEVSLAYCKALYARECLRLGSELETVYDTFRKVAEARYKEGETGVLELMNADRMLEKLGMEIRETGLEYAAAIASLKALTGCREEFELGNECYGAMEFILPEMMEFGNTHRGAVAGREIALAERELALAKNEMLPEIRLGATVQALIKGFNPYHIDRQRFEKGNFMGFEVGVSVPLFFGAGASKIRAAAAEKRISILNMEAAESEARQEFDTLSAALRTLASSLVRYEERAMPRAREMERIAGVSYELGDIDYVEYIANIEGAYEVYREYAALVYDYNCTVIKLKNITSGQ